MEETYIQLFAGKSTAYGLVANIISLPVLMLASTDRGARQTLPVPACSLAVCRWKTAASHVAARKPVVMTDPLGLVSARIRLRPRPHAFGSFADDGQSIPVPSYSPRCAPRSNIRNSLSRLTWSIPMPLILVASPLTTRQSDLIASSPSASRLARQPKDNRRRDGCHNQFRHKLWPYFPLRAWRSFGRQSAPRTVHRPPEPLMPAVDAPHNLNNLISSSVGVYLLVRI